MLKDKRGGVAQSVRSTTLIHGVVGLNLASGIGQAKSCPTKSEVPQCLLLLVEGLRPCTLASGCYCKDEMRLRPVHVSWIEKAVYITIYYFNAKR